MLTRCIDFIIFLGPLYVISHDVASHAQRRWQHTCQIPREVRSAGHKNIRYIAQLTKRQFSDQWTMKRWETHHKSFHVLRQHTQIKSGFVMFVGILCYACWNEPYGLITPMSMIFAEANTATPVGCNQDQNGYSPDNKG